MIMIIAGIVLVIWALLFMNEMHRKHVFTMFVMHTAKDWKDKTIDVDKSLENFENSHFWNYKFDEMIVTD